MDAASILHCFADAPPIAGEVARGVTRLFCRHDLFAICEVPLPNGRRADMMAIDAKGSLTIVEIKVGQGGPARRSQVDRLSRILRPFLLGGPAVAGAIARRGTLPSRRAGLIVADRYDAAIMRDAAHRPLAPARRKAELLRFARRAARRLVGANRPDARARQLAEVA